MKIRNFAPDSDVVVLTTEDGYTVTISREADGDVYIEVKDNEDGNETVLVLGKPGETQKV